MDYNIYKYENLNAQFLFDKFKEKYDEKCKCANKKYMNNFNNWIKSYYKSNLVIIFMIILIASLTCFIFHKENLFFRVTFLFSLITFFILSMIDYYLDFNEENKIVANNIINEIICEENILVNKENLDELIKESVKVGSRESRIFKEIKSSHFYNIIKSSIVGFIGVLLGYITSNLSKSNIEEFDKNVEFLFTIFIFIFYYISCFYTMYLSITKAMERHANLYIQILKDKKLTLIKEKE